MRGYLALKKAYPLVHQTKMKKIEELTSQVRAYQTKLHKDALIPIVYYWRKYIKTLKTKRRTLKKLKY